MPINATVGTVALTTAAATTTFAVVTTDPNTGTTFQPKAIFFWWTGRNSAVDAIGRATHQRGCGFATGTAARRAVGSRSLDASASAQSHCAMRDDACIVAVGNNAIEGLIDLNSINSDGFTLIVDDALTTAMHVHYLALGGTSLTDVTVGTFSPTVTTGTQTVTGVGFQPDCVIFTGPPIETAPPSLKVSSHFTLGAAAGASPLNMSIAGASTNASAIMDTSQKISNDYCLLSQYVSVDAVDLRAAVTAWAADGFTLTYTENSGAQGLNYRYFYLALKGGDYTVGDLLTPTDTTTTVTETGMASKPAAVVFLSTCSAEQAVDAVAVDDRMTIGAATTPTQRVCAATLDEDSFGSSQSNTAVEYDAVYVDISEANAVDALMDLTAMNADGFSVIMDDARASQSMVVWLAIGPAATVGASLVIPPSFPRALLVR